MKNKLINLYHSNKTIIANAGSLVGASAVTSALGFVYWWLAARLFPPAVVGLGSAMISAMLLLSTVGMLGLGTLLMGELSRTPEQAGPLISTALVISSVAGIILGLVSAWFAPFMSNDLAPVNATLANVILFSLGVAFSTLTAVLDQALIGLLKGSWQLGRNAVFALAKLLALLAAGILLSGQGGMAIYFTWLLGNLISLLGLAGYVAYRRGWRSFWQPVQPQLLKKLGTTALSHHWLNLALQASPLALPVLVTILLSATTNAHFYLAWLMLGLVFLGPLALATMLYTTASANPAQLATKLKFTLGLSLTIGVGANLVLLVGADLLLGLFGPDYAREAGGCLRILGLAVFPLIFKDHYVAVCRVQNRVKEAAVFVGAGSLAELALAALGSQLAGLIGLSLGWVIGVALEGLLTAPVILKILSRSVPVIEIDTNATPVSRETLPVAQHLD